MKKIKLKIEIFGDKVSLSLTDKKDRIISKSQWVDNRNLSEKLLVEIDLLLKQSGFIVDDILKVDFDCDSPYCNDFEDGDETKLENISSKGRCGFTSWQIGETTAKVLNFNLNVK
jgi:tRNA A37 threonylcarbamoyladenosine modification protein TsaB